MKQISMDFNKRQYMRPVDFELFYYNDTDCALLPLTTMITANFIFFWKEMSNTTSVMPYTNFPTVTAC